MKIKYLSLALLNIMCFSAVAAEANSLNTDNSFFKDSKFEFSTRNHWKYLKENASQPKEVHSAWGQALTLNYKSGYWLDILGFDVTYDNVIKLGASDYFATRNLLYNTGKKPNKHNAHGFNKFTQRYAKVKLGNSTDLNFNGKVGWHSLKDMGVISSSQNLTRNSYLGYSGTFKYSNLALSLAYIDSALPRESAKKVHFYSLDRKSEIDNIKTAEIAYKDKVIKLDYSYGVAKDYIKRHAIEFSYKPIEKLTVGSQIYGSTALKNHDKMKANVRDFDDSAWHYAADVEWKEADWSAKFGIAYTDANRKGAIGYYGRHIGKNNRGRYNGMAAAGADYMRDGEVVLSSVLGYDFFKDNTTGLYLNYGEFNYKHETLKNGEINVFNIWKPTSGTFKNLSILSKFGYGWSYKTMSSKDITPKLRDGHAQRSPTLSAETVIDYRFNLL
ncbi:OprD family outer membrane porin [Gilliamella sp. M0364]|uniref:OprD family outer membrane porin n=1 Tax=Gilliamella sp. M0364 TaxID=2751011 RepID=UPI0018DDA12F|nr:OprD family outer membrane porin [Gilliamella sp. M0364]MBI0157530.1 outer membrane porin, OprD family [Gilliamella sp. M0364]